MEERKYYPLTREQQGLVDLFGLYPEQQILNLCVRLEFEHKIDEALLLRSIEMLPELLPYCRIRVHQQDENTTVQYLSEEPAEPVQILDVSGMSGEEIDQLFDGWAHELFPNNYRDVQLYKFRILRRGQGRHTLFFCAHHFIMDAFVVISTVEKLGKIYTALSSGEPLPKAAPAPWALVEQEAAYYASERFQKDKAWWAEIMKEEPQFTSLNGKGSPEFLEGHRYGAGIDFFTQRWGKRLHGRIPSELVEKINAAAAENHVSAQLYYLLALRSYLGHVSGTDDVIVDTAVARRSTLVQKQSGLTRANAIPFRSVLSGSCSFEDGVSQLDTLQKEYYRHADVLLNDFFEVLDGQHDLSFGQTYHTTWLTYQPYFDLSRSELKFTATSLHSGAAAAPLYVYITPQDDSGDLIACYDIAIGYIREQSVEDFHRFMLRFLEQGISEPKQTLEELIRRSL